MCSCNLRSGVRLSYLTFLTRAAVPLSLRTQSADGDGDGGQTTWRVCRRAGADPDEDVASSEAVRGYCRMFGSVDVCVVGSGVGDRAQRILQRGPAGVRR